MAINSVNDRFYILRTRNMQLGLVDRLILTEFLAVNRFMTKKHNRLTQPVHKLNWLTKPVEKVNRLA